MKTSAITALLLASTLVTSVYAIENVKVDGKAKLWYQTGIKDNTTKDMFQQESTSGQAALELGAKADIADGLKGKVSLIALSTLGLEKSFISAIPSAGAGHENGNYYRTQVWVTEANLDYKIDNTSIIVGRQALNTPLLFTERWNASFNTFDGALVINSDIPNTTLVAGYVNQHNGSGGIGGGTTTHNGESFGFGSSYSGGVVTDGKKGAYAFGAMIKPIDNFAVNLWYYNVNSNFTAYWADASYKASGLFMGVQNAGIDVGASGVDNAMVTAVKLGYTMDKLNLNASYSITDEGNAGTATIANFATSDKSKVYTQAVFQDGAVVGTRDTEAWRLGASYKFDNLKLIAFLQNTDQDSSTMDEGTEFDLIFTTKIAKLVDLKGIYVHRDVDMVAAGADYKEDALRLIASVKF
ncbi:MAG: porin [Sulfurimonas sp.]|nr:porin [Sulfurimonas sp.]